jgi:hypothetical protein
MTHIEIRELLAQIDNDFNQSIMSIRQLMSSNNYSSTDKKVIAMKITHLVDKMKTEVLPWTK